MYYQEHPSYYFSHRIIKTLGLAKDHAEMSVPCLRVSWPVWNIDTQTPAPNKQTMLWLRQAQNE